MEQAQGWERPGYFIKDRTAPVRGYDWFGCYDHVPNTDKRYYNEMIEDYTWGFSKQQEVVSSHLIRQFKTKTNCFSSRSERKRWLQGTTLPYLTLQVTQKCT